MNSRLLNHQINCFSNIHEFHFRISFQLIISLTYKLESMFNKDNLESMFNKCSLNIRGRSFQGKHVFIFGVMAAFTGAALTKQYFAGGWCYLERNIEGKLAVITGGNTGIGKETARRMAQLGCTVIIGARDTNKNEETVKEIKKQFPHASICSQKLDLGDKKSIIKFVEFIREEANKTKDTANRVDYLINNAGISSVIDRRLTADGLEMQIGINHFGHFYLTYQLWDLIKNSPAPRIVNVSSIAHSMLGKRHKIDFDNIFFQRGGYEKFLAYVNSKLANILFTKQLQRRMKQAKINGISTAVHPGIVRTQIHRYAVQSFVYYLILTSLQPLLYIFLKSPQEGAQTTLYALLQAEDKLVKGGYYSDCREKALGCYQGEDHEAAQLLWKISEEVYGINFDLQ